jgi:hypothetical protein
VPVAPPLPRGKTRFLDLYAAAAVMGFGADQVDLWEPYQFSAAWLGWRTANAVQPVKAPSDDEFRLAVAMTVH